MNYRWLVVSIVSVVIVAIIVAVLPLVLSGDARSRVSATDRLTIVTTFFPLYDFTRAIVGDSADVVSLVPTAADPHSYEPSASQLRIAQSAAAFVTLGPAFSELEQRFLMAIGDNVAVISAAAQVSFRELIATAEPDHAHEAGHVDSHSIDPHVWLSPTNAQTILQNITEGLVAIDIARADIYVANSQRYLDELKALDATFRQQLQGCLQDHVIVTHDAYRYLADEYGFETISIHGIEPGGETTSDRLITLIESARQYQIRHIFYETLLDRRVPEVIAAEIGADLLVLHPLEYVQSVDDTYLSLMTENMSNLRIALQCQ